MEAINKKNILFLFIIILLLSCNNQSKKSIEQNTQNGILQTDSVVTMNAYDFNINDEQVNVIKNGDTVSYNNIKQYQIDRAVYSDFIYYALIMSDKYHYPQAYYDVYICLFDTYDNKDELGSELKKMGIEYLKKAAELGVLSAKEDLGKMYIEGKFMKKDIEKGQNLINQSKKNK